MKIDNKSHYYESIIVGNVDKMSKYLKISRPSKITDGKFEVTIFTRRNKLELILVLLRASFIGVSEDKQVSRFELETIDKTLVQTDGEVFTLDAHATTVITIDYKILTCVF